MLMMMMMLMLTKWNKARIRMLKATWKVLPQKLFNCLAGKVSPVRYNANNLTMICHFPYFAFSLG